MRWVILHIMGGASGGSVAAGGDDQKQLFFGSYGLCTWPSVHTATPHIHGLAYHHCYTMLYLCTEPCRFCSSII